MSSKKTPLPAPPQFDPSSIKVPLPSKTSGSGTAGNSGSSSVASTNSITSSMNLPKPPPLPLPKTPSRISKTGSSISSTSVTGNHSQTQAQGQPQTHEVKERIPKLESAAPSTASLPSLATEPDKGSESESDQPIIPKLPKRKSRFIRQPPRHLLSLSQRAIPILILSSPGAKSLTGKNNLTLSELFNGLGNSLTKESSVLGKLSPIRSVNRMVHLKWEIISLCFLEKFGFGDGYSYSSGGANTDNDTSSNEASQQSQHSTDWEERLTFVSENWPDEEDLSTLEEKVECIFHSKHDEEEGVSLISNGKTPWFARFRHGINQQTSHQEYSMIHSPPAVLYVASSAEGLEGLEKLREKKNLPDEFQNGLFDPNGMKEQFLILHDEHEGDDKAESGGNVAFNEAKVLQEMTNRFGPSCSGVVRMNSNTNTDEAAEEEDEVWDEFLTPDSPKSLLDFTKDLHLFRGALLSPRDKLALRRFIAQMVTTIIMPAIEQRIYLLNVEVTNHKKGVKNVFKSFWRKPKDGSSLNGSMHGSISQSAHGSVAGSVNTAGGNGVAYRYDSIESQTRLLADTLFLVRDYEGALGIYRLVRDDYKHDQNTMHNASVHEMMALCMYFTDLSTGYRSTREIIQYIDSALYLYTSAAEEDRMSTGGNRPAIASIATRCVTRLCLLLSSTRMLCQGRDNETADSLAAASSKETPLGAAVLLEQSSGHYHRAGMNRKFAFHMLMAGHMYRSAAQEYHAVRCFASAMYVYHGGDRVWNELFNHLTSALAGQLYGMKRMQLSLQLYAKLVGTTGGGKVSVRSQQKFLDHLIAICRSHQNDALESAERMKIAYDGLGPDSLNNVAEEVMKSTPHAKRVLEIPNMNLPKIFDSTIKVQNTSATSPTPKPDLSSFGNPSDGSDSVWQDLVCSAKAELRATKKCLKDQLLKFSPKECTQRVIEEIDEELSKLQIKARAKKNALNVESAPTRAKLEPISVSFDLCNPLSIFVPVSSIQLVAKMTCSKTNRVYTNVDAIDIAADGKETKKMKKWKFAGSEKLFEVAQFSRISPDSDGNDGAWKSGIAEDVDPFFLVSKDMIGMEPKSKSSISLELCPLVMGDLEIVGVRCKLFNEIWIFHKFKVRGSLLHDSAFNRMNKVRSVPYLLRSKIECNMPNLAVEVIQKDDHDTHDVVLQGQVTKWTLKVTNQGAAHATNLCLKTNVPWFNVMRRDGVEVAEDRETSYCIGPSGTMMRLPLQSNVGISGSFDTLSPGETVNIPIEIRTSGGGRQGFYMLFYYELFEKTTASKPPPSEPKHRWLRKMVSVAVYPSLTLTASLTPSFSNKKDCILSVEMTNYRSDMDSNLDIAVDKISIASKNYEIKPLVRIDRSTKSDHKRLNGYLISWQEQAVMHYIISPIESNSSQCTISHCFLAESNVNNHRSNSVTDFICLEHAHNHFTSSLEKHRKEQARIEAEKELDDKGPRSIAQIRRAKTGLFSARNESLEPSENGPKCDPTSRAFLCSPHNQTSSEINVVCSWKTKGNRTKDVIVGQHHLRQLVVRPQQKSKSCPLLIEANYKQIVQHDFSISPLNLNMRISIRNRLVQSKVDFEFSLQTRTDLDFVGPECFRKILNGGEEIAFPMDAVIFQSGMFNLQCVKLTVHNNDGSKTPYVFPLQWIVHVNT